MIKKEKQRMLLELFADKELRVTEAGVVEWYVRKDHGWRPVAAIQKKDGYGLMFRKKIYGKYVEFPVAVASLLWKYRKPVAEDFYVDYIDGNPENLAPSNLSVMNAQDYRRWLNERRSQKAQG